MVWDGWTVAERTADLEGLTWYLNNTKFTHKDLEGAREGCEWGEEGNGKYRVRGRGEGSEGGYFGAFEK